MNTKSGIHDTKAESNVEILHLMARYNKVANLGMFKVLKTLSSDDLCKDIGLYYKSLIGTLQHYLVANNMLSQMLLSYIKEDSAIKQDSAENCDLNEDSKGDSKDLDRILDFSKELQSSDVSVLEKASNAIDEQIICLIDKVGNFETIGVVEFPGITFKKPRFQLILSVLVHSTHHRGQIAAGLDMLGIENDFAGMLGL